MDASDDAILSTQTIRYGAGKGVVQPPNLLRSSRCLEHRAPLDAHLRLFPDFRDENDILRTVQEEQQQAVLTEEQEDDDNIIADIPATTMIPQRTTSTPAASSPPVTPPAPERTTSSLALKYATQLAGRDFLAGWYYEEQREAEQKHIMMLNL